MPFVGFFLDFFPLKFFRTEKLLDSFMIGEDVYLGFCHAPILIPFMFYSSVNSRMYTFWNNIVSFLKAVCLKNQLMKWLKLSSFILVRFERSEK